MATPLVDIPNLTLPDYYINREISALEFNRRVLSLANDLSAQVEGNQISCGSLSPEVVELLDSLDEEDRAMVILKYAEDYTFADLAEMFGMTTSACKMRVSRARQRLQARYGSEQS